jgi:hypothetical protein
MKIFLVTEKRNVDCLIVYYRGSVRVERPAGRSAGPIFQVSPSAGVPSAVTAIASRVAIDQVLFAKMKCRGLKSKLIGSINFKKVTLKRRESHTSYNEQTRVE